ncbi:MAG TPA: hypothetical protein VFR48_00545 [Solirubrobacteraceae bacterium]|nr:hypothetical protein [Solirubrobacteraceae bacterium]
MQTRRPAGTRWIVALVAFAGVVNLIVLLGQLPALVRSLYRNADSATALVLADGLGAGHETPRLVTLGHYHYYEAWLLEKATAGLPDHWQLWEAIPVLLAFFAIALMVWTAWRALGTFAALLTGVIMVALGDEMREILFTPDTHGYFVVHTALLAATLVFLADRAARDRLTWPLLIGVGVPLAALSTLGATDQLFEFVALPSFVLAGCLGWWRHPGAKERNIAIFCVAVGAIVIVGCQLLDKAMIEGGVISQFFPVSFVGAEALFANLQVTVTAVAFLGGGQFWGAPLKGTELLVFAVGALALVGVGILLRLLWRYAGSLGARERSTSGCREIYLAFWMFVVVISLLVFTLSSLPSGLATARYLPGVFAGSAALLPGLVTPSARGRVRLAMAVAFFAILVAVNHVIEGSAPSPLGPSRAASYEILKYVRAEDAAHGYAPYWDASAMAWQTRGTLRVYPAIPYGPGLHPFPFNEISTWYKPVAGVRSFLVSDSRPVPESFSVAPVTLGKPVNVAVFGPYTVDIYDHDIAENLG